MTKFIKIILTLFISTGVTNCNVKKNKITTIKAQIPEPIKIETLGK